MNLEPKDNMPYFFIGTQATYIVDGIERIKSLVPQRVYKLTLVNGRYMFQTGQWHTWFSVADGELFIEHTKDAMQGWLKFCELQIEQKALLHRMTDLKISFTSLKGFE